ncbi:UDP-GlcNAc:undecaprenyl-phosphate GlcNAc-1-phosphate transferase [Psychromicrobium silvestre]|uniref:UDP-GlcNAc:undecaprenyl-phosphate GlcNAc-1-phosphate transferase n=1 Tax=Psychromicrobium silvestre TaxID=1645614 RepID=A0A7Y9LSJ9_9MICC|nr:MraY family glycosyltransferase [Psychromicrobium silvestre]NYE94808.1 UDP-GlcNAc:undecaprenyl-phosphate GlcNAc-1-phosphate transferase [Psychromicrobium silvestre]
MTIYLLMMALAAVLSYAATWGARGLARKFQVYTPIRERDVHSDRVARLGGVGLFVGFAVVLVVASNTYFVKGIFKDTFGPWGILIGAAIVVAVGIVDDVIDLRWWIKLLGQIAGALVVATWGVRMLVFPWPGGPLPIDSKPLQFILTVFFIVLVMNAFNFIDGLDGLAVGVAAISGLAFFLGSYWVRRSSGVTDWSDLSTLLMALLVGICVGFLVHNWHPAKIFMGDSGSMLIGLIVASGSIAALGQKVVGNGFYDRIGGVSAIVPIVLPVAILLVPLLDLSLAVVRRTMAGRSPFAADRGHLHHRLLDLGYSHRGAVLLMYAWTFVMAFGGIAFAFFRWQLVIIVDLIVVSLMVLITVLRAKQLSRNHELGTERNPVQGESTAGS